MVRNLVAYKWFKFIMFFSACRGEEVGVQSMFFLLEMVSFGGIIVL